MKYLLPITLVLLTLSACGNDSSKNNSPKITTEQSQSSEANALVEKKINELIFGKAFRHCQGETCVETYRLTAKELFEDSKDDYNHKTFDFTKLSNEQFESVKSLINEVPIALWDIKQGRVGCPDCADGGGIYIQFAKDGVSKSWFIDNNLEQVPESIRDFVKKLQKATQKLSTPGQAVSPNPFEGS